MVRAVAVCCVAVALLLSGSAVLAAQASHERACRAALAVLQRCAAATNAEARVRDRCCNLYDIFQRNGCDCPGCLLVTEAEDDSHGSKAPGKQLALLAHMCSPPTPVQRQQPAAGLEEPAGGYQAADRAAAGDEGQAFDEDFSMSAMAGRAAWAQDPRSGQQRQPQQGSAADAAIVQQRSPSGPLLDTPDFDYDNQMSDADAAFMLVDPAAAGRYASAAARLAARLAADLAADVVDGQEAAARIGERLQARLTHLLAGSRLRAGETAEPMVQSGGEDEALASAAAVSDDVAEGAAGRLPAPVRLAPAAAVPRTPEQRRAAALAAAVERQQARNLALRRSGRAQAQPALRAPLPGLDEHGAADAGDQRSLSVDITIDADDPEAARRMVSSIAALLRSWEAAAGSANSQTELAAALEGAVARVAAAARRSSLGRGGLEPRELLVQQFEEGEARTCACLSVDSAALHEPASDLAAAAYQRYLAARLAICRFACRHEHALAGLLVGELALCVAWLAVWLLRHSARSTGTPEAYEQEQDHVRVGSQFLVVTASDPQWHADLRQPLLHTASCSSSEC